MEAWERVLPSIEEGDDQRLVREYVATVLRALGGGDVRAEWPALTQMAVRYLEADSPLRTWILEGWVLLASPEAGLPAAIANEALEAWSVATAKLAEGRSQRAHEMRLAWNKRWGRDAAAVEETDKKSPDFHAFLNPGAALTRELERLKVMNVSLDRLSEVDGPRASERRAVNESPSDCRALREAVREAQSSNAKEDPARRAVVGMWRKLTGSDDVELRPDGRLEIRPRARLEYEKKTTLSLRVTGTEVEIARAPRVIVEAESPVRSFVYRLAWDVAALLEDVSGLPFEHEARSASVLPWEAITISSNGARYHWPIPAYPPLFFWEALGSTWNTLLEQGGVTALDHDQQQHWIDELAATWVKVLAKDPLLSSGLAGQGLHLDGKTRTVVELAGSAAGVLEASIEGGDTHPWIRIRKEWALAAYHALCTPSVSGVSQEFARQLQQVMRRSSQAQHLLEDRKAELLELLRVKD
ncbi:MAG: hypothetical protein K8H88_29575 [Sandaracinaceae bacterium]|nr:hypothetical protein [Sandaracinaceae bacterium]